MKTKPPPSDADLLKIYLQGFNDELNGKLNPPPGNELKKRAYQVGRADAIAGDDITSIDLQSDATILRNIKEGIGKARI